MPVRSGYEIHSRHRSRMHNINLVIDSRERGCKVYLTGISKHFRKIFRLVGLTKYAEIVESVEEIQAEEVD